MSEAKRNHVHQMWAYVAERWADHADLAELRGAPITSALDAGLGIQQTDRVLELACGPGGYGLHVASAAAEVVLTDVVPAMVDIAAKRAADTGVLNARFAVRDLEAIDEPDAAYDVVVCRDGLMFAADPVAALRECARVLRAGGRLGVAVWAEKVRNPWLGVPFDAMSERIGHEVPPAGMPGPFSLGDADALVAATREAGFGDVTLESVDVPLFAPSLEAWWARTRHVMPLAKIIERLSPERQDAIDAAVRDAARPYVRADGTVLLPGTAHVLIAR